MPNITMKSKDVLAAGMARCFVTLDDRRYNLFNAIKLEAKMKKKKTKIPILGKPGGGNRAVGWEGSGTLKIHFNTSIFRRYMLDYSSSGKDFYFDMQITNEDPTNDLGRQTVMLYDCNIDESIIALFDASSDGTLEEDISFTFENASMSEEFAMLTGLLAA